MNFQELDLSNILKICASLIMAVIIILAILLVVYTKKKDKKKIKSFTIAIASLSSFLLLAFIVYLVNEYLDLMDPDTFRVYFAENGGNYVNSDRNVSLFPYLWYSYDPEDVSTLDPSSETLVLSDPTETQPKATVSDAAPPPDAQQKPPKAGKESERQKPPKAGKESERQKPTRPME